MINGGVYSSALSPGGPYRRPSVTPALKNVTSLVFHSPPAKLRSKVALQLASYTILHSFIHPPIHNC